MARHRAYDIATDHPSVDIEGHTVSHSSLNARKGKTDEQYLAWLKSEIAGSKEMLEKNLDIQVKAFAYPYGLHIR